MGGSETVSNTRGQEYATGSAAYGQQPAGYSQAGYPAEAGPSTGAAAGTVLAGVLMMIGGIWDFLIGISAVLRGGFDVHVKAAPEHCRDADQEVPDAADHHEDAGEHGAGCGTGAWSCFGRVPRLRIAGWLLPIRGRSGGVLLPTCIAHSFATPHRRACAWLLTHHARHGTCTSLQQSDETGHGEVDAQQQA